MEQNARVLVVPIVEAWAEIPAGQLVGVSEDLDAVDRARQRAEELGHTDCMFIEGSVTEIPWRNGYFDVIYTNGAATDEVRRVGKPDAVIHEWYGG